MPVVINRDNLMRWAPDRWDQFIGNKQLKKYFRELVKTLREQFRQTGRIDPRVLVALLLVGVSRSGKSAIVKFAARCVMCQLLDDDLNPCAHTCPACRQRPEIEGREGLYSAVAASVNQPLVNFIIGDCTKFQSRRDVQEVLDKAQGSLQWLDLVYFDEAHRLVKSGWDEMLLREIEDKLCFWILATAKPEELETMLRNRLIILETELPEEEEMAQWLVDRCQEYEIAWCVDAIMRGVNKVNRVPGLALKGLSVAATNPGGLTLEIVERYW